MARTSTSVPDRPGVPTTRARRARCRLGECRRNDAPVALIALATFLLTLSPTGRAHADGPAPTPTTTSALLAPSLREKTLLENPPSLQDGSLLQPSSAGRPALKVSEDLSGRSRDLHDAEGAIVQPVSSSTARSRSHGPTRLASAARSSRSARNGQNSGDGREFFGAALDRYRDVHGTHRPAHRTRSGRPGAQLELRRVPGA